MFGMKLRSWMEARIVRARKKRSGKEEAAGGGKRGSAGGMPGSAGGFPAPAKGSGVGGGGGDGGDRSSSSDPPFLSRSVEVEGDEAARGGGAAAAVSEDEPRPASDYSANLSSPESAYSTGYSTDGTSPGASFPPEYYINLRTGTHYFQQQQHHHHQQQQQHHGQQHQPPQPRVPPPPPPPSPPPPPPPPRRAQPLPRRPPPATLLPGHLALSPRHSSHLVETSSAAAAAAPYSPSCVRVKGRCGQTEVRFAGMAEAPVQARGAESPADFARRHRRTESAHEKSLPRPEVLTSTPLERRRKISNHSIPPHASAGAVVPSPLLSRATLSVTDSPRQRTRIRTNPWTSTKGAVQSPGPLCGLPSFAAASEGRDIHTDPPLRERDPSPPPPAPSGAPPKPFGSPFILQRKRVSPALSGRRLPLRAGRPSDTSSTSSSASSRCGTADEDDEDEDATLNEMGKFDESYVYEKETDILSDSDPTDCGDEEDLQDDDEECFFRRDDVDDDMDFIDNGSVELDARCRTPVNTGHCTYVRARRNLEDGPRDSYGALGCTGEAARRRATAPRPPSQRRRPSRRGGSRMRRERRPPLGGGDGGEEPTVELDEGPPEGPPTVPMSNGVPERLTDYTFNSECEIARADREADQKYRELIRQAERILVRMQGSRSLEEDDKVATRSSESVGEANGGDTSPEKKTGGIAVHPHRSGRWRTLGLECADISLPLSQVVGRHVGVHPPTPTVPEARLLTFRSVGVGREPEEGRPHCPQSEPLKRKVYTCAALQRIRRTLMGDGSEGRYEEEVEGRGLMENGIDDVYSGINKTETLSPSRVSRCRGRRASSWHKSNHITIDTQENGQFGQRMVLLQRHILLQTIEGLKRSLEDQSATLHDVYKSSQTTLIET